MLAPRGKAEYYYVLLEKCLPLGAEACGNTIHGRWPLGANVPVAQLREVKP